MFNVSLVKVGCWVSLLLVTLEGQQKRHIGPNDKVFGVFTALPNLQIYFQAHVMFRLYHDRDYHTSTLKIVQSLVH